MRVPLPREAAAFSAISRQHTTLKKETFSSHSLVWRFCQRRLTATPNVAFAVPLGRKRSSGSRVTLPTRVMVLSAIFCSCRSWRRFGGHSGRTGRRPVSGRRDLLGDANHL